MKLFEFCQSFDTEIVLESSSDGYVASLTHFQGYVWQELEAYADKLEGGTTFSWGRGKTPNDALDDWCKKAQGRLLVFQRSDEKKRRLIRGPKELAL